MSSPTDRDIQEQLAKAWMDYKDQVRAIYSRFTPQQLLDFAGEVSEQEVELSFEARKVVEKVEAQTEAYLAIAFEKAKPVLDAGAKIYCFYHNCDGAECYDEHFGDEEE